MQSIQQQNQNLYSVNNDKGTTKGNFNYASGVAPDKDKSKSVITDASTVVTLAQILNGKKEMNVDQLAKDLQQKGYQVQVTKVDGRNAIQFQNGDVFVDSNGDGNLGNKDFNFDQALIDIEQKYGVNLNSLIGLYKGDPGKPASTLGYLGLGQLGSLGIGGQAGVGGSNANGQQQPNSQDVLAQLGELDPQMAQAGYDGSQSAFELWQQGLLGATLDGLGLSMPNLPRPQDVSYNNIMQKAMGLFQLAYGMTR